MFKGITGELSALEKLDKENRLIKLDYPYNPRRRDWSPAKSKIFDLIVQGNDRYRETLKKMAQYARFFENIDIHPGSGKMSPSWINGWFPTIDAISLYGLLAINNPKRYIEVGSGNSTLFARQAIIDHGLRTTITSIDPYPRESIDTICDEIVRLPCEEVPSSFFNELTNDDVLFIDNSHRSFPNSDVTVFFMEILPYLPKGLIYGIHDIFIPWDYPDEWKDRFYNEQYLLSAYLLGGADQDEIVLPNAYLSYYSPNLLLPLKDVFENTKLSQLPKNGTAFWIRRG
jgi:hypothetical protein